MDVREQKKRSATTYCDTSRPIKRSKTQARRGARGFLTGAYIDVREQKKTQRNNVLHRVFFVLITRRRKEDLRYDTRFVRRRVLPRHPPSFRRLPPCLREG